MFFDFPEIVIIFGIALVVLGPKKLPHAAAQIGRWVGRARAMARQFREQLEQEVHSVESALDTHASREPTLKPTPPASVTPEAPPAGDAETPEGDPLVFRPPGTGWQPGDTAEGTLAPYGDPNAAPAPGPGSSEAQLPLELDVPHPRAPAAATVPADPATRRPDAGR